MKKVKAKLIWFSLLKGYGELHDEQDNCYFVFGHIFGGDMFDQNIPQNNVPEEGATYLILKSEEKPAGLFVNNPGRVVTKLKKVA